MYTVSYDTIINQVKYTYSVSGLFFLVFVMVPTRNATLRASWHHVEWALHPKFLASFFQIARRHIHESLIILILILLVKR